jgi:hypothetical protein
VDDLKANSCDITERRNLKDTDVDELYLLKGTKKASGKRGLGSHVSEYDPKQALYKFW